MAIADDFRELEGMTLVGVSYFNLDLIKKSQIENSQVIKFCPLDPSSIILFCVILICQ